MSLLNSWSSYRWIEGWIWGRLVMTRSTRRRRRPWCKVRVKRDMINVSRHPHPAVHLVQSPKGRARYHPFNLRASGNLVVRMYRGWPFKLCRAKIFVLQTCGGNSLLGFFSPAWRVFQGQGAQSNPSCASTKHVSAHHSFVRRLRPAFKRDHVDSIIFLANITVLGLAINPVLQFFFDLILSKWSSWQLGRNFGVRLCPSFRTAKEGIGRAVHETSRWMAHKC